MTHLKKIVLVMMSALVVVFVQGTLLRSILPVTFVLPNFLVVLVVYISLYEVSVFGAFLAFLAGLVMDFCSGNLLGPWAGASTVVFGGLAGLSQRVFVGSPMTSMVGVFFACMISSLVSTLLRTQGFPALGEFGWYWVEALLTAFLSPLAFWAFRRVIGRDDSLLRG